jgi:hypothetical protein
VEDVIERGRTLCNHMVEYSLDVNNCQPTGLTFSEGVRFSEDLPQTRSPQSASHFQTTTFREEALGKN